jgi:glycosyltransferase involved in cell wall biosynthesis
MASSALTTQSPHPVRRTGTADRHADVLIVQEYVPEYRRRFYELLEDALSTESIGVQVVVGTGGTPLATRGDAITELSMVHSVPASSFSIAGRRLTLRRLSGLAARSSLVVVEQALRHLETYPLLLRQRRGPKVALWGHGTRRVKPATHLERALERRITRSAHWFFAYTQGAADQVAATRFPRDRISVVQNTLDVAALAALRDEVSAEEIRLLREELDLPAQNVCLFIGALDPAKRIEFLLEASAIVAQQVPDFVLIVAGDGSLRGMVEAAAAYQPWLRYVGRAVGPHEARLGAVADILLMPGAVGLVSVDSFALRTPIITTRWPFHGPEAEYLEDGINARFVEDSVGGFAHAVAQVLQDRNELDRLRSACAASALRYPIDTMVDNFAAGVLAALRAPRR